MALPEDGKGESGGDTDTSTALQASRILDHTTGSIDSRVDEISKYNEGILTVLFVIVSKKRLTPKSIAMKTW